MLDLSTNHAAYAGRLLADLGADVLRIEPPAGSPVRGLAPLQTLPDGETFSFAQAFLDAGKRSIVLDLASAADGARFAELAAGSDVIIATPDCGDAADPLSGLDAARQRNPGLIVVSISPFGLEGPYAGYRATDLTVLAAGGLLALGGYRDTEPLAIQGEQAMLAAGIFGAVAALAAVYERTQTGRGQWIDVSGQECVAFALEDAIAEWSIHRNVRRRHGDGAREAGTGVYPCRDGYVSVVAGRLGTAKAFVALTEWVAESDTPGARRAARAAMARLQIPPVARRHRALCAHLRRLLPDAWQAAALSRGAGAADRHRAGQHRRGCAAGSATRRQWLFHHAAQRDPAARPDISRRALPHVAHAGTSPGRCAAARRTQRRSGTGAASPPAGVDGAMRLDGLRVLDFCWIGAGAFVTRVLADLGADVIKVESRAHPDNLRLSPPHQPGAAPLESSGYFASRNTSKRSFALNMSQPRAREIALQLAQRCSIVSNNFRPGVMDKWGLGYEAVAAINPSVIYLAMPMQGATGPHRDYIGFGSTIAALCGLVSMAGKPGPRADRHRHALSGSRAEPRARAGRGARRRRPSRPHRRRPIHRAGANRVRP